MILRIEKNGKEYKIDTEKAIDISIPLIPGVLGPNCFYAPILRADAFRKGLLIGSVKDGGTVNFYNLRINPHGNGTHTECVGHINAEHTSLRNVFHENFLMAHLITVYPQMVEGDRFITRESLEILLSESTVPEALIIRTMPNDDEKLTKNYSGNNPPFFAPEAMEYIVELGVRHLLTDLPSVDKEEDGGALSAHKIFWQFPENVRTDCTITELIYVDNKVKDGNYFLNLQRLNLALDASPSRPVIFKLEE